MNCTEGLENLDLDTDRIDSNCSDMFLSIISPYTRELRAYCQYLTGSTWDSEDLYQETLLKAYVHYQQTGFFTGVRAFMYRVARNIWIDDYRKRRRRLVYGDVIYLQVAYEDTRRTDLNDIVEWLISRLPRRYMNMFMLAEMFDYTNQEIADELSSTIPAVKCVLHRTRRIVRGKNDMIKVKDLDTQLFDKEVDHWVSTIVRGALQKKLL